jgi:drug/metabolite transporter (DMT)-like permease
MDLAIFLSLIATLGWGAGDVFVRKAMFSASPETVAILLISVVVVALGITGVALEGAAAFWSEGRSFFALTALMGLLTWLTGNLLYFHGMQLAGVIIAAPILGAAPLLAIGLAVAFGGERPGAATLIGAFAVVAGVSILVTDRDKVLR